MTAARLGGWSARALAAVLCGASCLEGPPPDNTTSSSTTSTTAETATTGTSGTSIQTSTTASSETSSGSSSGGPSTTDAPPACDDGEENGDETDVDCGGSCSGCSVGQGCSVGDDCKTGLCGAGVCVAPECVGDNDCGALDGECTKGVCDPDTDTCVAQAANEGGPCENGDLCSTGDTCAAGECKPGTLIDCSDFDGPCTVGECDPNSGSCGLFDKADGSVCDDGDGCTFNESCMMGNCLAPANEGAIFFADFSSASGWTLQAPWEIGPAKPSASGPGGADPGTDHTASDDNGVAGTAIGGFDTLGVHGPLCMTSPSFDSTNNNGTLWLSFWRHLHSPANTTVINRIEIWNGAAWKLVESGYAAVVNDNAWSFQKYNVTGNAAKDFRVRICVERKQGAQDFAGWSVDDLVVASSACTP